MADFRYAILLPHFLESHRRFGHAFPFFLGGPDFAGRPAVLVEILEVVQTFVGGFGILFQFFVSYGLRDILGSSVGFGSY